MSIPRPIDLDHSLLILFKLRQTNKKTPHKPNTSLPSFPSKVTEQIILEIMSSQLIVKMTENLHTLTMKNPCFTNFTAPMTGCKNKETAGKSVYLEFSVVFEMVSHLLIAKDLRSESKIRYGVCKTG